MSGGGGSGVTGFKYYMGLHFGLSHGPLDAMLEIRAGDRTAWVGAQTVSGQILIASPDIFGGDQKEGGIYGFADVMMGESTQLANAYLTSKQGPPQPSYRGLATLVYKSGEVGANNPYPKPWTFRVRRNVAGWQGGVAWNSSQAAITLSSGVKGQNPAHIIYEALTNSDWGMGYPTATIDNASFLAAAAQLYTEGFGLCVLWNRENSIEQFVQDVINNVCGAVISDPTTGLFVLKLMRGGYDPSLLPVFTEDNVIEILSYDAPSLIGSINEMVVTYIDPTIGSKNYGGQQCVAVQALGSIQAQGAVVSQKRDYPHIATADLALRVAQRDLAALSTGLKRIQLKLDRTAWQLIPTGLFVLNFPPLGIASMIFRIGEINYGTLTDSAITITAVQDVFSLPASSYVAVPVTGWVPPNGNPTAATLYMALDLSYRDALHDLAPATFAALAAGQGYTSLAIARPTGLSFNYQVWSVVSPGSVYVRHGVGNFTPTAIIQASIGPFDTALTLLTGIDLANVVLGTAAIITDGTNFEVVKVVAIDPVLLTATITRGCLDTVCYAFSAGARIWFLDGVFGGGDGVEYVSGETVDTRPLTATSRGVLDITLAPTVICPIFGRQWLPYPPAYLTVNGTRWDLLSGTLSGTFVFAWRERNRVTQADTLIDQTAATLTPEVGQSYTLNIYDDTTNTLLSSMTGITATTASGSAPSGTTNVRAELFSVRGGYASWQKQVVRFPYMPPTTVPGAPTIGTAVRGNAQASVAFTPGTTGGSPITSFTATSSPGGITASGASSPIVVTGLTNGTAYTFTVTATNINGTGPASAASNSVTPATVPGAPTIGTAVAGAAQADVAFTAPGSNGGSVITSYTATSSPGGFTASGATSPITVTGLTNGTPYTFTVTATNAVGTGAASAASNSVTPMGVVNAKVLLHFDGTNGSTTFTDVYGHSFTQVGGAALTTANPKFGSAALRLNGSTDGVHAMPSGTEFDLPNDYTMEGFVFYNTVAGGTAQALCSRDDGGGSTNKWGCGLNVLSAGNFSIHRNYAGTQRNMDFPWVPTVSTYYHIALQHDHVTGLTWFAANGVVQGVVTGDIFALPVPTTHLELAVGYLAEGAWYSNADYDDFRLSDVVRYPINFTPPAAAGTTGTHLLHMDGASGSTTFTDVGTDAVAVTPGGTAQVETSIVKFGSGALDCGTQTGWLTLAHSADQEFGTSDFTIHGWGYLTAIPTAGQTQATFCAKMPSTPLVDAFQMGVDQSGRLFILLSSHTGSWDFTLASAASAFTTNVQHHIAAVRRGAVMLLFLDGNIVASANIGASFSLYSNTSSLINIGAYDGNGDYGWIGKIDEFCVESSALWAGNFTPPAAPFTF